MLQCCCSCEQHANIFSFFCCLQQPPLSHPIPKSCGLHGCFENAPGRECIFLRLNLSSHKIMGAAPAEGSCVALPGDLPGAMQLTWRCQAGYLYIPRKKTVWHLRRILKMLWKEFRADDSEDLGIIFKEATPILFNFVPFPPCKSSQRQVDALADVALAYIWVLRVWTTQSRRRQTWWTMDAYECLRLDLGGLRLPKKRDQWDWWYFSIWIKKLIDIYISKLE